MKDYQCIICQKELNSLEKFTGTDNCNEGHSIDFYWCNNKKCERFNILVWPLNED